MQNVYAVYDGDGSGRIGTVVAGSLAAAKKEAALVYYLYYPGLRVEYLHEALNQG
jgi:hypothetical protein